MEDVHTDEGGRLEEPGEEVNALWGIPLQRYSASMHDVSHRNALRVGGLHDFIPG